MAGLLIGLLVGFGTMENVKTALVFARTGVLPGIPRSLAERILGEHDSGCISTGADCVSGFYTYSRSNVGLHISGKGYVTKVFFPCLKVNGAGPKPQPRK